MDEIRSSSYAKIKNGKQNMNYVEKLKSKNIFLDCKIDTIFDLVSDFDKYIKEETIESKTEFDQIIPTVVINLFIQELFSEIER